MALELEDLKEFLDLAERQLEELRELRRELERQSALLERLLEKIASLERSQYS
jgi:AmiR/NasT family two-component response regulator